MQIILGAQSEDVEARPLPQRGRQLGQIAVRLPCTPANALLMPVYHRTQDTGQAVTKDRVKDTSKLPPGYTN